ncbi:mitochondrial carrier protein [Rhizoctonia solani]|uniref:Mitochondrial carrier protein n=1 Tax=Rhizoctonia solani TaxID=456999 RepID=A0A8H8P3V0_9AGAM|nr:mitochondrial carrier protein [Rhizoctonia solani]QRW23318.1 mitochondrial carrier protein [Rhizoctonia solani]
MVDEKVVLALKDIAYGSAAGMVSKVFEHPFDLCKVRLQAQVLDTTARFAGPIDCLYKTWKFEGIRGLYRGLPMPIVGAMAENASLFLAYNKIQDTLLQYPHFRPSTNHKVTLDGIAIAGGGAGTVASFLLTPIELIKCKMQVQMIAAEARATPVLAATGAAGSMTAALPRPSFSQLEGPVSLVASVVKSHGVRGLWLGHTGTMIRETGGGAHGLQPKKQSAVGWHQTLATSHYINQLLQSAVQTEEELRPRSLGQPRPTFLGTARAIWKAQGVRGFYAGMGVTVARAIPSSAIIFVTYDGLVKYFG